MLLIGGRGNDGRSELNPSYAGWRGGFVSVRMAFRRGNQLGLQRRARGSGRSRAGILDAAGIPDMASNLSRPLTGFLELPERRFSRTCPSAGSLAARYGRDRRAERATVSGRFWGGGGSRSDAPTSRRRGAAPWRRRDRRNDSAAGSRRGRASSPESRRDR